MSTHARTDQNLLFGILALQMDFIGRDALVAAMNAWVLQKSTPLGQVLLKQGAIDVDTHALLDALVRKHLQMHGDAQKSLAAVSSVGSVRRELEQIADAELHASLVHVSAARAESDPDPFPTRAPSVGVPTSSGLRFHILRPHAKGGLGEVFVAHDEELHREVALKEIQNRHADDPNSRARFLLEAEITGGLEHPGIVPVYGLGQYSDGRPYYAMRFIPGDSLKEAIARFHKAEELNRNLGERALALRQLLGRFVDVCNAIAYAHSRGVLHRDLKPGNVMLGPYGETLVVDWGLAKALGSQTTDENGTVLERPFQPRLSGDAAPTQMGSALGTPAYMPPEQAAGRLDLLGPASDVYSLGAMLYCLLTGKAPVAGGEVGEVLRRVQASDFPRPRQIKRDVPAALEAVCLKAMALRPEDRYHTPRALAADVEKWLADEPVSAWREPLRLRVGRWARRHQTLMAATATGLLMMVLAAGSGAWWLDRQRTEQRRGVEAALEEVTRLQGQGRWGEARAVLGQARDRLGEGGPHDLRDRLEQGERDLDLVTQLDTIRLKRATVVEGLMDTAGADREYERVLREAGMAEVGSDAVSAADWVRATAIRDSLVAALDDWSGCARKREHRIWLREVAQLADPDPWRDRMRDPAVWQNKTAFVRMAAEEAAMKQSPQLLSMLGLKLMYLGADAERLLQAAQQRHPEDFWINFNLGYVSWLNKKPEVAVGYYRAALAVRPATPAAYNNLGNALRDAGRVEEAIAAYYKAIQLDPTYAHPHCNLGNLLRDKRQLDDALVEYRKALQLDPKDAIAHNNLGAVLLDKGKAEAAIVEYRKAIEFNPRFAQAHHNLGNVLRTHGKLDEAIAEHRQAVDLAPNNADTHNELGASLRIKGKLDEALTEFRQALELNPKNAKVHFNLASALGAKGRLQEAIDEYRKTIELDAKDANAHTNLGAALRSLGKREESIAEYRKAIEIDPKHALAHYNLGNALGQKGKWDEAVNEFRQALVLKPHYADARFNLGVTLEVQGKLDEAIVEFRTISEFDPKDAFPHGALGKIFLQQGKVLEAQQSIQRCLQLLPVDHPARQSFQQRLLHCQQMLALETKLSAILQGEARAADADELARLAQLCSLKKRPASAARFYAEAFARQPKLADNPRFLHRYNAACAAAQAGCGQGTDAATFDDQERARLRRQALVWLRTDLALWSKQIDKGTAQERAAAQKKLQHWQKDTDLAGLRDAAALEKLPEAERAECRKLWDEVAALLKK